MVNEQYYIISASIKYEKSKIEEYDTLKESLSIQIKTKLEEECEAIKNQRSLKDYSPIKHYNEMTELRHKFYKINKDLEKELDEIKNNLHDSLIYINFTRNRNRIRTRF